MQMLANMKDNSPLLPDKHGLGCTLPSCLHVKDVAKFDLVTNGPEGTMKGEFKGPMERLSICVCARAYAGSCACASACAFWSRVLCFVCYLSPIVPDHRLCLIVDRLVWPPGKLAFL